MRVSDSVRSEAARQPGRGLIPLGIALAYLAAHLPFLAPSLEDIDSINFALGLHHFDPALHQPHPPGYPVYIAIGRITLAAIHVLAPSLDAVRADALALALWSALGGAIALVAAASLFRSLTTDDDGRVAWWGVALLCTAPLFWICGLRPMSDMPGLAAVLTAQALLVRGARDRRALILGALVTGLAAGIRVQTAALTAPLLLFALVEQRRAGLRPAVMAVAAVIVGVIVWAVPLLIATGGVQGYLNALGSQAGEDFAWVDMVWSNPTRRRIAFALYDTLVLPWESVHLARAMGAAALLGVGVMLLRERRALLIVCLGFIPYVVFHILFQETVTVRYALPVVPAVAFVAARGLMVLRRFTPIAAGAVAIFALWLAVPIGVAYGREAHPAFRAIADMRAAAVSGRPGAVFTHYALRRPLQATGAAALPFVEPRRTYEWLGPAQYWRDGGFAPVWFLAEPKRTDLELIDPVARESVRRYRWSVERSWTLSGTRPTGVDWYRLQPPGWFVQEGWSLTPETGGITQVTGAGPDHRPIEAFIRRRPDALYAIVGAHHLGSARDGAATFDLSLDGRVLDTWVLDPANGPNVLRVLDLPAGIPAGHGEYGRLTIAAHGAQPGAASPPVAIRQFDVQPATGLMHAFGDGWYEDEYENATGRRWRWSSDRADLRIVPAQAVRVTLRAENPVKYFRTVPTLRLRAGGRVIAERRPDGDFEWEVTVPADDVVRSEGVITIETDRVYLPGPAEGTSDTRRLGLRVFDLRVNPVQD